MNDPVSASLDIKLMNIGAVLLGLIFVGILCITFALAVVRNPAFSVTRVTVMGDTSHNNEVTLRANVSHIIKGNFLALDLFQVRKAFEAVPWVRSAIVQREFPNRLRVTLQEHKSAALWESDSESKLVNYIGEIFEINTGESEIDDLPKFSGPEGQAGAILAMYRSLTPVLTPFDVTLEALHLSAGGNWRAQLDTGAALELGRGNSEDVTARMRRVLSTLTEVTARVGRSGLVGVESIDLRHNNGYALKVSGVTTVDADRKIPGY